MNTIVYSGSAITLVNAIKADIGSAIGIKMNNWVKVEYHDEFKIITNPSQNPNLIENCWRLMRDRYKVGDKVSIITHAEVKGSRGMKTSSAISSACISAISKHFKVNLSYEEIIELSTYASIQSGVSITGAADDAYASFLGGVAITDTKSQKLVYHQGTNIDYDVVLLIPNDDNPKVNVRKKLEKLPNLNISSLIEKIRNQNFIDVIQQNTDFYAPILLNNHEVLEDIQKFGAEVVGMNGAGPSLFALSNKKTTAQFMDDLKSSFDQYQLIHTSIRNTIGEKYGPNS